MGGVDLVTVHGKLGLEARDETAQSVEEGRQFFMLEVERLSGHSVLGVLTFFSWCACSCLVGY